MAKIKVYFEMFTNSIVNEDLHLLSDEYENSLAQMVLEPIISNQNNAFFFNDGYNDLLARMNLDTNRSNTSPLYSMEQHWLPEVRLRIEKVRRENQIARLYMENHFYIFEKWPAYITNIFVSKNIAEYNYRDRNKICLFFFGNGATFDLMTNLSEFFANRPKLNQRQKYEIKYRKCEYLFRIYSTQRHNPNYSERYYYYSIHENRMLYLDGMPRHFGQRQENNFSMHFF